MQIYNLSKRKQYLVSISLISVVVLLGLLLHGLVGYRVVAFFLLVSVSLLALFVDITPVIISAILSALLWDFLFIPPRFRFTAGDTEDQLLLLTYCIVVIIHAVLTYRMREMQKEVRNKELNLHIRPDGSTKYNPEPDFKFVVITKFLSVENEFALREGLLLNGYFFLRRLGQSDEKAFGLDKSDVVIEHVPLVYHRVQHVELQRKAG